MQNNLNNNERKDVNKQPIQQNVQDIYQNSILKNKVLSDICSELTCNEILDPSVEKVAINLNFPLVINRNC